MRSLQIRYDNKGIARIISTLPTNNSSLDTVNARLDISLHSLLPDTLYNLSLFEYGDISEGKKTVGNKLKEIFVKFKSNSSGSLMNQCHIDIPVHDMIGRAFVLEVFDSNFEDSICGVVSRSAGLFENTKKVCACSGLTLWEEEMDVVEN